MAAGEKASSRKPGEGTAARSGPTAPIAEELSTSSGPYADEIAKRERMQELAERVRKEATRAFRQES